MVMDIDAFLNKFENEIKDKKEEYNLEFQQEIESKISKIEENAKDKDISLLKNIYDLIKNFDQDLPNKFVGIEGHSGKALENLGEQYSKKFLEVNKNNSKIILNRIKASFENIEIELKNENFAQVLIILKNIKSEFINFPKVLFKEKTSISKLIKIKEIEIYDKLEQYKIKKSNEIKEQMQYIVQELKKNLTKKSLTDIEKSINELKMFINAIPKVIQPYFISEKIKINKILNVSEEYLLKYYEQEFNYRVNVINGLIEKFHANKIKKQVKTSVLIYNEILIEFKKMPEVFLEDKISMYNKINDLFAQLNALLIKNNIDLFIETYNNSKKIEDTREYIKHIKESKNINPQNLNILKEEIKSLPKELLYEQTDIINVLKEIEKNKPKQIRSNNPESPKQISQIYKEIPDMRSDSKKTSQNLNNNVKINMLKEIEVYYDRLKKTQDEIEIKKLYEKILFYLRLVRIEKSKKIEILNKVKLTLKNKNINF